MLKPIVIYCSETGSTEAIANKIAFDLGCEKLKIEAVEDYSNYFISVARIGLGKLMGKKAYYANLLPDLSEYDVIIFGYPIWYGAPPEFAVDFMRNCQLDGKIIVPFSTSGASPITVSLDKVRAINPNTKVLYPLSNSVANRDNYDEWLSVIRFMTADVD